jgi:hypothetical protein
MAAARSSSCSTFPHLTEGLVGGKDHRAFFEIAIIHHMEQNIGGVGAIAEIPDFVNHDDVRASTGYPGMLSSRHLRCSVARLSSCT